MPTSWISLAVALLAIVPGFIATTVWARARTWKGPSGDLRTVLQSLALSGAIQVLVSPLTVVWIVPIRNALGQNPGRVAEWFFITVLVLPILLGLAVARWTDRLFARIREKEEDPEKLTGFDRLVWQYVKATPPPDTWDWLFTTRPPQGKFLEIGFDDNTKIGGVFGEGGYALTNPETQGIFLPQEWMFDEDGNFQEPRPGSAGLLIPRIDKVRWIRILEEEGPRTDSTEGELSGK